MRYQIKVEFSPNSSFSAPIEADNLLEASHKFYRKLPTRYSDFIMGSAMKALTTLSESSKEVVFNGVKVSYKVV